MKHLHLFTWLSCLTFIAALVISCDKDQQSMVDAAAEDITIQGLEPSYVLISDFDTLKVNVQAVSTVPNQEFSYTWGIYETSVQGAIPKLDTIATGAQLRYPIKLNAKTWVLVLMAKNLTTGITEHKTANLQVVTEYTRGWYIAKTLADSTDMDLFLTPQTIQPKTQIEDVYSRVNGHRLPGRAQQINFFSTYKSDVLSPNIYSNTKMMFLQTQKDVAGIFVNTMKTYRNANALFYGNAPQGDVGAVFYSSSANYFIHSGRLHSIYAMSINTGLFGAPKLIDDQNSAYQLSSYYIACQVANPILFDDQSSSFVSMSMGYGPSLTKLQDQTGSDLPNNNNNQKVLYMGYKTHSGSTRYGVAILQDKTNTQLKSVAYIGGSQNTIVTTLTEIQPQWKLYQATQYTTIKGDENMLYFVSDNKAYSYNINNQHEQLQFTPPVGEEITFIKHQKYNESANPAYSHNYIIVGTQHAGNYSIRCFEKISGNLAPEPHFIMHGKGIPKDIIYVSPTVHEGTYPHTF